MEEEGVIKFEAAHREGVLSASRYGDVVCELVAWREILSRTGLVGQDPTRYGGAGYGNVSARVSARSLPRGERTFVVSGTQTSGRRDVGLDDFCVVESYDLHANRVQSHGPVLPSSESMTHGAIYDLGPHIQFVLHVHSPAIWRAAATLRIPTTDPAAGYGTPEMARDVQRLFRSSVLSEGQILAMGGHEDGIVVFGRTAEEAGSTLMRYLARAYRLECSV